MCSVMRRWTPALRAPNGTRPSALFSRSDKVQLVRALPLGRTDFYLPLLGGDVGDIVNSLWWCAAAQQHAGQLTPGLFGEVSDDPTLAAGLGEAVDHEGL